MLFIIEVTYIWGNRSVKEICSDTIKWIFVLINTQVFFELPKSESGQLLSVAALKSSHSDIMHSQEAGLSYDNIHLKN